MPAPLAFLSSGPSALQSRSTHMRACREGPPSASHFPLPPPLFHSTAHSPVAPPCCPSLPLPGEHLDPLEVVASLPETMPLGAAAAIVSPLLRDRMHRRRQGAVTKNLHRAALTAARAARVEAEAGRVVVDDERACPGCHLRIGGKVFVVLQQQEAQQMAAAGAAVGSSGAGGGQQRQRQQQQQQQQPGGQPPRRQKGGEAGEVTVLCYNCYRRSAGARQEGGALPLGAGRRDSGELDLL